MLSVDLQTIKPPRRSGRLEYGAVENIGRQTRLEARYALTPVLDLSRYTCSAVIDWLKLRVHLKRPTQFMAIQRTIQPMTMGRRCYVDGPDLYAGVVFDIKIQEPQLSRVIAALVAIDDRMGLAAETEIVGIEVSVDFIPRDHSQTDRELIVAVLGRHIRVSDALLVHKRDRPRCVWNSSGVIGSLFPTTADAVTNVEILPLASDGDCPAYVDATYYIGRKDGPLMYRIMDKILDSQDPSKGTFVSLPPEKCRARIEVMLTGSELHDAGLRRFSDLRSYSFSRLQRRFMQFALPTFSGKGSGASFPQLLRKWLDDQRLVKFALTGIVGLHAYDRAWDIQKSRQRASLRKTGIKVGPRARHGKGKMLELVSYSDLNRRVQIALRHLGGRWR